jgi:AcrR family transcriptional regulator
VRGSFTLAEEQPQKIEVVVAVASGLKQAPSAQKEKKKVRSRDPQESRRALIEAAGTIFNTVGYYGTDTNRIAVAAGYTPGTFYTHFTDKREIFLEVYRGWVDAGLVAMAEARQKNATTSRRQE